MSTRFPQTLLTLSLLLVSVASSFKIGEVAPSQERDDAQQQHHDQDQLTQSKVESIKDDLRQILFNDALAHALRISFHDCVGVGKCDGCVNAADPRNAGPMLPTKALMDSFYDTKGYRRYFSRGDFYALAGIAAVEIAIDNNNNACRDKGHSNDCQVIRKPTFDYQYGRVDCPTSPLTTALDPFPAGASNHSVTIGFFSQTFGLDVGESVALLGGGHSLGGAHASGTGFLGLFKGDVAESRRFNNKYFQLLTSRDIDYRLTNVQNLTNFTTARWQWDGYKNHGHGPLFNFMLNTDVSLVYEITPTSTGMSTCSPLPSCGTIKEDNSPFFVNKFADDVEEFLKTYSRAYVKMVNTVNNPSLLRRPSQH